MLETDAQQQSWYLYPGATMAMQMPTGTAITYLRATMAMQIHTGTAVVYSEATMAMQIPTGTAINIVRIE